MTPSPVPSAPSSAFSGAPRWVYYFALAGLAHWFFGNFYEAIVLAPNMLTATLPKLRAWQAYFTLTNQIYYYVPVTQLAVAAAGWDWWRTPRATARRARLGWGFGLGAAALLLTGYIVTQLNLTLFFGDLDAAREQLPALALRWNIGNMVRVALLGGALVSTYRAGAPGVSTTG